jgi:transaldolase
MYVVDLAAPGTVNTMPTKTMQAVADHGVIAGDQVTGNYQEAGNVLDSVERLGISYADVTAVLETEGVEKFATSWAELLSSVQSELTKAAL